MLAGATLAPPTRCDTCNTSEATEERTSDMSASYDYGITFLGSIPQDRSIRLLDLVLEEGPACLEAACSESRMA